MTEAMSNGLEESGYGAIVEKNGNISQLIDTVVNKEANRIIILEAKDWKSDLNANITKHVDLKFGVYSPEGDLLAKVATRFFSVYEPKKISCHLLGNCSCVALGSGSKLRSTSPVHGLVATCIHALVRSP